MSGEVEYVVVSGGLEGLFFADMLYVRPGQPNVPVRGKTGQALEIEFIPEHMFKASLKGGILNHYIQKGLVKVQPQGTKTESDKQDTKEAKKQSKKDAEVVVNPPLDPVTEFMNSKRLVGESVMVTPGGQMIGNPKDQPKPNYGKDEAEEKKLGALRAGAPEKPKDPRLKEFDSLGFVDQIKFVKRSDDKIILDLVYSNSTSKQLKNNVSRRLKELNKK